MLNIICFVYVCLVFVGVFYENTKHFMEVFLAKDICKAMHFLSAHLILHEMQNWMQ